MDDAIKKYTNQPLPHFFKYAKDKKDGQIVGANKSFVNKLEDIIPNPRLAFKRLGLGDIDCSLLMNNQDIEFDVEFGSNGRIIEDKTDKVIVEYLKFDRKYYLAVDSAISSESDDKSDSYMRAAMKRRKIADEIKSSLSSFGYDDYEVADILVRFLYDMKKSANKTALWLCYGDILYGNLKMNMTGRVKEVQCVDCGRWFEVRFEGTFKAARTCRCDECAAEHKRNMARARKRRQRENEVISKNVTLSSEVQNALF